jgi:hypothetical protein
VDERWSLSGGRYNVYRRGKHNIHRIEHRWEWHRDIQQRSLIRGLIGGPRYIKELGIRARCRNAWKLEGLYRLSGDHAVV